MCIIKKYMLGLKYKDLDISLKYSMQTIKMLTKTFTNIYKFFCMKNYNSLEFPEIKGMKNNMQKSP